jgi:3-deoxy-manno-octulosonate cytidylyltransferase (CMP-KDO synthetase)
MKTHIVIPARMASTRLPGKPLIDIAGVPMIVRVARQASLAAVDSVIVAVDDVQVQRVAEQAGFTALLTSVDHPSGSDRVMEVVERQDWDDQDIVINVQGDEPLLPPAIIDQLTGVMAEQPEIDIATLSEPIESGVDFMDPNIVKVVVNAIGQALYFSRAPIPFPRDELLNPLAGDSKPALAAKDLAAWGVQRHVGVYAFRVAALRRFVTLTDSKLERIERLEQLRWLEAGHQINVLPSISSIPGGVDTPEDLLRVEQYLLTNS